MSSQGPTYFGAACLTDVAEELIRQLSMHYCLIRAAGVAHGTCRHPRYDSTGSQHLLGPNGNHHHGGPVRGEPALYALWFRVRADESSHASVERPRLTDQIGRGLIPIRIAAE